MRRAFIAFGILVFLVYCWASVAYQNRVRVPDYRQAEIILLGDMTPAQWDADQQARFQRLMRLEDGKYQLEEGAQVPTKDGKGFISSDRPLTADDFEFFVQMGLDRMKVRDPSAIYGLLAHNYLLRDSIAEPGNPEGLPLYMGGNPLDKKMLEDLRRRGFRTITITGYGSPVSFQLGTAVMVAVIFLTLVAALKPVLWDPFTAMLEKRRRELEMGAEAERQNQLEATRFEEERRNRNNQLYREVRLLKMQGMNGIAKEAGGIVKEARDKEKEVKVAGLRQLAESADAAQAALSGEIPQLAEAVADALTPGRGGRRPDLVREEGE